MLTFAATILMAGLIGPLDKTVVSPDWLEKHLTDPAVVVVEIGSTPASDHPYIPGARFLPIDAIVAGEGWPPDEMKPVDQMKKALESAGIGDDGHIIIYSAHPLLATRAWLTFDYLGQGDRTRILDGGLARWKAENRPLATKRQPHTPKTFTPRPDSSRLVTLAQVKEAAGSGALLIDARSPFEFHGFRRGKSVVRRGHIPDATCAPWQSNLTAAGSFRGNDELKVRYEQIVGKADRKVIVYCRTGMEASMPYFILRSLGYDVALFDGSYAEWAREKALPVASTHP